MKKNVVPGRTHIALLLCLSMLAAMSLAGETPQNLKVEALFKGSAMINIGGKRRLLKVGKESPEGVRLIRSTTSQAVIEWQGKRHRLSLSSNINSSFAKADKKRLAINKTDNRAYYVSGSINGQTIRMLLDTGATSVAMNSNVAKRLGIDFRLQGRKSRVSTASGVADSFSVQLRTVSVGGIEVKNVAAVVIVGDFPRSVLLGMSYLNHVKMAERDGVMMLEAKY